MEKETGITYFKGVRVAIVIDDLVGPINYQTCPDADFLTKAEEQGNTWSLQGFQRFIDSGEMLAFMNSIKHPNYMMTRFIDMYEDRDGVYCDSEGISNPTTLYDKY